MHAVFQQNRFNIYVLYVYIYIYMYVFIIPVSAVFGFQRSRSRLVGFDCSTSVLKHTKSIYAH